MKDISILGKNIFRNSNDEEVTLKISDDLKKVWIDLTRGITNNRVIIPFSCSEEMINFYLIKAMYKTRSGDFETSDDIRQYIESNYFNILAKLSEEAEKELQEFIYSTLSLSITMDFFTILSNLRLFKELYYYDEILGVIDAEYGVFFEQSFIPISSNLVDKHSEIIKFISVYSPIKSNYSSDDVGLYLALKEICYLRSTRILKISSVKLGDIFETLVQNDYTSLIRLSDNISSLVKKGNKKGDYVSNSTNYVLLLIIYRVYLDSLNPLSIIGAYLINKANREIKEEIKLGEH